MTEPAPAEIIPVEPSPAETPALLAAFRAQFERNRLELPPEWIERLRRLAAEVEASRRLATCFFVDLRRYTELAARLPPDRLDRLRQWFYEICARRVQLHGGFIIQFVGDAAFAAFGAPWSFERDAESALQALLEIRDEIRAQGRFEGSDVAIRAGAETGPVNVRLTEVHGQARPDLFGSTVNLAARLEAEAQTWEILLSDTLADQVSDLFDLEPRPPFQPKNYPRRVTPRALLAHKGERAVRRRGDLAFVGREAELTRLADCVGRLEGGQCVSALIVGEGGVGKSRLVNEAMGRLADGDPRRVIIACEPHGRHIALRAALELVRRMVRLIGPPEADLAGAPRISLDQLRRSLPDLDPATVPTLGYLLGSAADRAAFATLSGRQLRAQVVSSLVGLFEAILRCGPWWVFVDDAHWCDPFTWEIFSELKRHRPPGLFLTVAVRPSAIEPIARAETPAAIPAEAAEADWAGWERVDVGPLPPEAMEALLDQLVDPETFPSWERRRLLEEAEGIPLYLIEMVRARREIPSAVAAGRWTQTTAPSGLPPPVSEILQARVDHLRPERRAVLQWAAVLGRRVRYRLMSAFEPLRLELLGDLYSLATLGMLRSETLPEDLEFRFTPSVLRDVAYGMIPDEERRRLHRRVAVHLEQRADDPAETWTHELALHWTEAGEPAHAGRYLWRACRRALQIGGAREALDLARRALAVSGEADGPLAQQQRAVLEESAGLACRLLGDYPGATRHFESMRALARDIGNPRWRAQSAHHLAATAIEQGQPAAAEGWLAHVPYVRSDRPPEEARRSSVDLTLWARGRVTLGVILLRTGRLQEALDVFSTVAHEPTLTAEGHPSLGDAWNNAGLIHLNRQDLASAREAFLQALAVWDRLGNPFGQTAALNNLGIVEEKLARFADADERYRSAGERAEAIGYLHLISAVEANRANLALLRQDWPAAERNSQRSLRVARLIGHRNSEAIALENLGQALVGLGRWEEARLHLEAATALGEQMADPTRRDSARLALIWTELQAGRVDAAASLLALLTEEPAEELRNTRRTLTLACRALAGADGAAAEAVAELEGLRASGTLEDYLRRLDALILMARRGRRVPIPEAELLARRRAVIPD